jgi:PAS domain S-box-containing protein
MVSAPDKSDAQVRRELERYKMALEVSEDGIWEYPGVDPTQAMDPQVPVVYSPHFYEMLGYTAEEFPQVAASWWNIIHPDDMEVSTRAIAAHLAEPRTPMYSQYRVRDRQGNYRWWEVRGTTMPDAVPGRVRAIGVVRDITAMKHAEETLREQLSVITEQQSAIRSMSTPIIQVWDGILTLPLIGTFDTDRATEIMERLLSEVTRLRARHAILDLTGIETVDTTTAEQLYRIIRAVGLLGARAVLSGLNPAIAQTLTELGVDTSRFVTYRNMQGALQACIEQQARRNRISR